MLGHSAWLLPRHLQSRELGVEKKGSREAVRGFTGEIIAGCLKPAMLYY